MSNGNQHKYEMLLDPPGESRWATPDEIKSSASRIDLDSDVYPTGGLPVLIEENSAWVDGSDAHSLIFGTTGSKKTRLFIMPLVNVLIKAGESFIVADPKGEIYARTSGLAKEKGFDIRVINLRQIGRGDFWNPVLQPYELLKSGDPEKKRLAVAMINDIVSFLISRDEQRSNDPFWPKTSHSYLTASMRYLIETAAPDEANVSSLLHMCTETGAAYLKYLNRMCDDLGAMNFSLESVFSSAPNTLRSIIISSFSYLNDFAADDALTAAFSRNTIDMPAIGERKTAFYLIIPDEKTTYNFLAAMLIKQLYECLIGVAQSKSSGSLPVRVNFVLDEFCNLPQIPQMANMISAGRSRNIRFFLIAQSLHQLKSKYNEDADTILGNCENLVFLASRELELLTLMEALCGKVRKERALISVSELQRLSKDRGEALLMIKRNYPFISAMRDIDSYTSFGNLPPAPMRAYEDVAYGTFRLRDLTRKILDGGPVPFSRFTMKSEDLPERRRSPVYSIISHDDILNLEDDDTDPNSPPERWIQSYNMLKDVFKTGRDPEIRR